MYKRQGDVWVVGDRPLVHVELTAKDVYKRQMRYGLYGGKEHTQREIADMLGISRSYVSRIEKKSIEKLRMEFEKNNKKSGIIK